jgi:hypothetical protein
MNCEECLSSSSRLRKYKKPAKREKFLAEIKRFVPWKELYALICIFYPKTGRSRSPLGLERMIRIHFLQNWFNLSNPQVEEVLHVIESIKRFENWKREGDRLSIFSSWLSDNFLLRCSDGFLHVAESRKRNRKLFKRRGG